MNATAELVKTSKIQFDYHTTIHNERVLAAIGRTNKTLAPTLDKRCLELQDKGFHCFVGKDIEAKFKYKAGLKGSLAKTNGLDVDAQVILWLASAIVYTSIPIVTSLLTQNIWYLLLIFPSIVAFLVTTLLLSTTTTKVIDYVGDIPDFVLSNLDKAKECGLKNFIIYSCEPLPTKTKFLLKVDPVLIGWLDDNVGVVIGIWDRDKEITI